MDYCPYDNLRIYMLKNRVIPEAKAAKILLALVQTLTYLHQKGICHRDIKPENILYDEASDNIKLIDF